MPYSTVLEDKIEGLIHAWEGLEKKKMFGGICYLVNGNMAFAHLEGQPHRENGAGSGCGKARPGPCRSVRCRRETHEGLGRGG